MEPELPDQSQPDADEEVPGEPSDIPPAAAPDPAGDDLGASGQTPPPPPPGFGPGAGPGPDPDPAPAAGGGGWAPGPGGSGVSPGMFQFLRSREDRKLGGVAGGLAAASGVDPLLARLAIVLGCLTGWGILVYLIAWAVIPKEDPASGRYLVPAPEPTAKYIRVGLVVAGAVGVLHVVGAVLGILSMVLIGLATIPAHMLGLSRERGFDAGEAMLGLLLLVGGCVLLFRRHLPWKPAADSGPGGGPASWSRWTAGPGATGATGSSGTGVALATITPGSGGGGGGGGGGGAAAGGYGAGGTYGPPPPPPGSGAATGGLGNFGARATAAARVARTNGPLLLVRAIGWLVGLWFLAAAIVGGVFWVTGALRVRFPVLPIVAVLAALGVLGYTLLRSRRVAAVVAAMALLLVPTALAAGVTRVDGQAGDRSIVPRVPTDLDREYRHAIGVLNIDLSNLQLPAGQTPLKISMGAGKVEVTVPWDTEVEAKASVGAGSFDLFGNRQTGVNLNGRSRSTGQPGAPVLVITGKAGAGEISVRRGFEPYTHQALRTGQQVPLSCYPTGTGDPSAATASTMSCSAADGVTTIPALACVVSDGGSALCRPTGEPEPAVAFANEPGTRRCQVPAGGGQSTCTAPIPGSRSRLSGGEGSFTCTIPEGGGRSVCKPTGSGSFGGAPEPQPPLSPTPAATPADVKAPAPTTTVTSGPSAPPGEYRCTVPDDGGPTTCEPA